MKKYLTLTFALVLSFAFISVPKPNHSTANDVEINWMTLEEAVQAQKENPKKIMIDAYTDWCGPCKMLSKVTFKNPDLAKYVNDNYYAVKFDAEGDEIINFAGRTFRNPNYNPTKDKSRNSVHELTYYFRVQAYPTILFLDEQSKLITPIKGYYTPQQLEIYLKLFAEDKYKEINSKEKWEAYQKNFKPTFK